MSATPSIVDIIGRFIDGKVADINVAMPGIVVSYDAATQKADVKPSLQRGSLGDDGGRVSSSVAVISGVPVVFPGAGSYSITFPVAAGDCVLLVFSQRSLDRWVSRGGEVDTEDDRLHDLSDAIAIPGLRSFNNATDQTKPGTMVLSAPQITLGSNLAVEPVVKGTTLTSALASWSTAVAAFDTAATPILSAVPTPPTTPQSAALTAALASVTATTAALSTALTTCLSTKVTVE